LHDSAKPTLPNHATTSNAGGVTAGCLTPRNANSVPGHSGTPFLLLIHNISIGYSKAPSSQKSRQRFDRQVLPQKVFNEGDYRHNHHQTQLFL